MRHLEPRTPTVADPRLDRLRALGRVLDASIRVPGTRWRFGWDAILGLVPGVGDATGAALSAYIILQAARLGVPRGTLLRMAGNVGVEALVGMVPLLGDLFDAAWKANLRNLALLEAHLEEPTRARRASRTWALGIVAGLILVLLALAALGAAVVVWLARVFG